MNEGAVDEFLRFGPMQANAQHDVFAEPINETRRLIENWIERPNGGGLMGQATAFGLSGRGSPGWSRSAGQVARLALDERSVGSRTSTLAA